MSPCKYTVGDDLNVTLMWPGIGCVSCLDLFLASTALSGSEVEVKGQCPPYLKRLWVWRPMYVSGLNCVLTLPELASGGSSSPPGFVTPRVGSCEGGVAFCALSFPRGSFSFCHEL